MPPPPSSISLPPSSSRASLCIPPSLIPFPLSSSLPLAFLSHFRCSLPVPHISNYIPWRNNALYIPLSLILFTLSLSSFHSLIIILLQSLSHQMQHPQEFTKLFMWTKLGCDPAFMPQIPIQIQNTDLILNKKEIKTQNYLINDTPNV